MRTLIDNLFYDARPFTKEEATAYQESLKKLFTPTGKNAFEDTQEDATNVRKYF